MTKNKQIRMEKFRDFALKYLKIAEKDFERAKR
jgi:hypothetical protein